MSDGDARTARRLAQRSLGIFRAEGDEAGATWSLVFLGWARFADGDMDGGRQQLLEALDTNRTAGIDAVSVNALLGLAYDAARSADARAHRRYLTDAFGPLEKSGGDVEEVIWLWLGAVLAAAERPYPSALRLAAGTDVHGRRHGGRSNQRLVEPLGPFLDGARQAAGSKAQDRWSVEGAGMTWSQLVDEALAEPGPVAEDPLSRREREVVELVPLGLTNTEIGERLYISKRTVESHLDHIKQKLGHDSRSQVMAWALREQLDA